MTPEARARQTIDALLTAAGWHVCDVANANLRAGSRDVKGVAIREFPLNAGHGFADYPAQRQRAHRVEGRAGADAEGIAGGGGGFVIREQRMPQCLQYAYCI